LQSVIEKGEKMKISGIQVCFDYESLKLAIETQLQEMPSFVYESAYNAAASKHDPDHKAAAAAIAALQASLPEIITKAIFNERLVRNWEEMGQ
jgi:hypothetical protein